jgi:4a-hydroxytetrahydrobiopterin dehydratase
MNTKTFQQLHENFISMASRPMSFGNLPITPQETEAPIFPVDRWREVDGALYKTYTFRRMSDRTAFVMGLMAYEEQVDHSADIHIDHDTVDLRLHTKDIGKVTEIDKEYAKYADLLWKDLVYSVYDNDK